MKDTIESVSGTNIKGRTFRHDLSPVTIFYGRSMSGKTAVMDAVKLAVCGYHPKTGNKPNLTYRKFGSGEVMVAAVKLRSGKLVSREWRLEGSAVKMTSTGEESVSKLPAVAFDIREYLELSGPAKQRYILSGIPEAKLGISTDQVIAELAGIRPEKPTKHTEAGVSAVLAIAREARDAAVGEDVGVKDFLELLEASLGEAWKLHKTRADTMQQTIQGATALSASTLAAEDCSDEMQKARLALDAANAESAALASEASAALSWMDSLEALKTRKANLEILRDKHAGEMEKADVLNKRLNKLVEGRPARDRIKADMASAIAAVSMFCSQHDGVFKRWKDETAKIQELDAKVCCPFCKSHHKGWRQAVRVELQSKVDALSAEMKAFQEKRDAARLRQKELEPLFTQANEDSAAYESLLRTVTSTMDRLRMEERAFAALPEVEAQIEKLKAAPPRMVLQSEIADADSKAVSIRTAIHTLEAQQKAYHQKQGAMKQQAEAMEIRDAAAGAAEACKLALAVVKDNTKRLVAAGIGGLLADANRFTLGIMRAPLEWNGTEVGYYRDGIWVSPDTLSGTEEALVFAALSVALAFGSSLSVVMIDELGVMDADTKRAVVARMGELVRDGVISQFVGADVSPLDMAALVVEGLSQIRVA